MRRRLADALARPVDGASLAAFRILFGLLLAGSMVRFIASGWIEKFYGDPTFHFTYWGFGWVEPLPVAGMVALHAALAVFALAIAVGFRHRLFAALFLIGFSYAELCDVTNYLNHYYLVALLALLLVFLPASNVWSVDARRRPRAQVVPAWAVYLVRAQIGVVYVYAGLAKLQPDWLLGAQPLNIWLTARADTAIIGPLLDEVWVHYLFSWAAFLFDSTIVLWLSWRRTRLVAFAVLIVFHSLTGVFFNIGLFPFLMSACALVFFPPDWPRRFLRRRGPAVDTAPARPLPRPALAACAAFLAFQVLFPARHLLYPGEVLWNEQGMRFAWKVMVREKHGSVSYRVRFPATGKTLLVSPRRYLTARQEREMAGQPDLILQLAHRIARDFHARGHRGVEVRADALVSLNGRPARPMIDPDVDLARVPDDLSAAGWITAAPDEPPILLERTALARRAP
jgi:vitamin K-dependent gamma-carboxylase